MQDYHFLLNELKRVLKEKKLKYTLQREIILRALFSHSGHHSPEELLQLIREEFPEVNVGIATLYRTLALFEEAGLAESLSFGKEGKRYEIGHKHHHDHLVCIECNKIIEFHDELIEQRQLEVAKEFRFKMLNHTMNIIGICSECQKKNEEK